VASLVPITNKNEGDWLLAGNEGLQR